MKMNIPWPPPPGADKETMGTGTIRKKRDIGIGNPWSCPYCKHICRESCEKCPNCRAIKPSTMEGR